MSLLKDQKDQEIKGQQSSKVKDQKELNSDQEFNFQKVQRSSQVFDLSSIKTGAVLESHLEHSFELKQEQRHHRGLASQSLPPESYLVLLK